MAFLFQKFQQAVKTLAKSPMFARDPRHLQFEADVNRLFLYTSYNRLGMNADEKDADEIIQMASKASVSDQQKQVQENIHFQIKNICGSMDEILRLDNESILHPTSSVSESQTPPRRSGLGLAVGGTTISNYQPELLLFSSSSLPKIKPPLNPTIKYGYPLFDSSKIKEMVLLDVDPRRGDGFWGAQGGLKAKDQAFILEKMMGSMCYPHSHSGRTVLPETRPLTRSELSQCLKDEIGYALEIKPSQIPHKEAGNGLFFNGEANVGSVIAFYPGIIYSPAYYQHIPGYPRVDATNSYLITRYDGIVINAQPWGVGGERLELWDGICDSTSPSEDIKEGSDRFWRALSKPLVSGRRFGEAIERRNPLAFGHFANHPARGTEPNVMVCPYDFPVREAVGMRAYIPNLVFGGEESVKMKRFGSFWFRSGGSGNGEGDGPVVRTLVLVATRGLADEEVLLNYRLSNSKRRPSWYSPVDADEDRRRWS